MAADWEEVKKLAFDFQRTQKMSSVQKLSERNCIDIVKRLIEMKAIDVIFTNDGKEYLTNDHLLYEIQNELYAAGGRIAFPDLVTILNVDYGHIEAKANYMSRNSGGEVNIVLGQLVSREYKENIASEIDLHLQESGLLAISDLSKQYDLPADFIMNLVEERLDYLIKGVIDKEARVIYTHDYIERFQSKIVGIFSAITRPVTLLTIINRYNISEKILNNSLEELLSKKRILGSISGPTFIPDIYSKNQQEYVNNFYKHNRYLDYSTLVKLGISNPQSFLKKKFGDQLCYLNTCAVDTMLTIQIETTLEDCIQNKTFVDLIEIMPSVLTIEDTDLLIKKTLEHNKELSEAIILLCDTIAVSKEFVAKTKEFFKDIQHKKAEEDLNNGNLMNFFVRSKNQVKLESTGEDKRAKDSDSIQSSKKGKKSAGGSGNTQGREIKMKAVKKKYKTGKSTSNKQEQEDVEKAANLEFLSFQEIIDVLKEKLNSDKDLDEVSEDFIEAVAHHIEEDLQKAYENYSRELFISHSVEASKGKKSFSDVQKSVNEMYSQIYLYNKGIQIFDSDDFKSKLIKHLQKTLCTDVVNLMLSFFAGEIIGDNVSSETRTKLISKLDPELKEDFSKLNQSLNAIHIDDFLNELDQCASKVDIMIKKIESKREKVLLSEHQQSLIIQLSECQDPILSLHISVLIVFQATHNAMLHATGKFVPQLLLFLHKDLDHELYDLFKNSQDFVLKYVSSKDDSTKEELNAKMIELSAQYKKIIVQSKGKKSTIST